MKSLKWVVSLVLLAGILASSLAACGGSDKQDNTPPEASTQEVSEEPTQAKPTATLPPTPTVAVENTQKPATGQGTGLDLTNLSGTTDLSSYRSSVRIDIQGTESGNPVQQSMQFATEYTRDPLAQHIVISSEGITDTQGINNIEMYTVGDKSYMNMGGSWLSVPAQSDQTAADAAIIKPEDMLGDTCGWKQQADTDYNGVKAEHWTASTNDMQQCMTAMALATVGDLTGASGDLYIAKDEHYVLHMSLTFEGKNLDVGLTQVTEGLDEGTMQLTYDMADVNQPFTIQVPEEALASGAMPEDIPVPSDATEVSNMMGMISFKSVSTPAQMADYYRAEMPKNGWTQSSDNDYDGTFMLEYTKDNRTASVMINTDEETSSTSVIISISEQ